MCARLAVEVDARMRQQCSELVFYNRARGQVAPGVMSRRNIARSYRKIAPSGDPKPGYLGPEVRADEIRSEVDRRNVARRIDSSVDVWEISWWPGRTLSREDALRAVVLADVIGTRQAWRDDDPLIEVAENLSARLGVALGAAIELAGPMSLRPNAGGPT